ncbi:hypothetical protein Tco_0430154, partial [Tanacetum coccineum]
LIQGNITIKRVYYVEGLNHNLFSVGQLESEVLVRSSKEANTSHAVAANLSELELKKILIDKMEANNSINRSDIQRQLYKALVEAYEADQICICNLKGISSGRLFKKTDNCCHKG